MITCCDWVCAAANGCQIGGYKCDRCGRYFCASDLTEYNGDCVCSDCESELIEEETKEKEDEE